MLRPIHSAAKRKPFFFHHFYLRRPAVFAVRRCFCKGGFVLKIKSCEAETPVGRNTPSRQVFVGPRRGRQRRFPTAPPFPSFAAFRVLIDPVFFSEGGAQLGLPSRAVAVGARVFSESIQRKIRLRAVSDLSGDVTRRLGKTKFFPQGRLQ